MSKDNNRVAALKIASQTKRELTLARAKEALHVMGQSNLPINFESVAKMAGVSKVWLYQQKELSNCIKSYRDKSSIIKRNQDTKALLEQRENEILELMKKLRAKDETIKKLKEQLEKADGEIYKKDKGNWQ